MEGRSASPRSRMRVDSEERWGVEPAAAERIWLIPFAGAGLVVASRVHSPIFEFITGEDSILEWTQVVAYVVASVTAARLGWVLWRDDRRTVAWLFFLFALGAFFVAGEEITWGQRILGIETPASFRRSNVQDEITIHNLVSISTAFSVMNLVLGAWGSLGASILSGPARSRRLPRDVALFVGPLFLTSWFLLSFLDEVAHLVVEPLVGDFTLLRFSEWPETCIAIGLAVFVWLTSRRHETDRRHEASQRNETNALLEVESSSHDTHRR